MFNTLKEKFGPGLLYAAVAVGVSHLVSSPTAGATYGLIMVAYAVLVCLVKYPTFLFGATLQPPLARPSLMVTPRWANGWLFFFS